VYRKSKSSQKYVRNQKSKGKPTLSPRSYSHQATACRSSHKFSFDPSRSIYPCLSSSMTFFFPSFVQLRNSKIKTKIKNNLK